jgi:hypothetical protein
MFTCIANKRCAAVLAALAFATPTILSAGNVALTFKSHDLVISGAFAGFAQDAYVIETYMGLLYVPAELVTCEGDSCIQVVAVADRASE